ncbi:MAG: hypothetical protein MJZ17_04565 [Bacteroidales bacterium]|nr:hypothetical protein [Bacteroidales bacterium]
MKTKELNNKGGAQAPYASPDVKVVEIKAQRVLCGSNEQYGSEDYNPWA